MGWFSVSRIGVSDLHHGSGTVGMVAGETVCSIENSVAAEGMGAAVFSAQHCPLGENGKTGEGGGAILTDGGIGQNPVVECNVNAVVVAVEGHRFYFNSRVQKLGAAYLCAGAGVENRLGTGG